MGCEGQGRVHSNEEMVVKAAADKPGTLLTFVFHCCGWVVMGYNGIPTSGHHISIANRGRKQVARQELKLQWKTPEVLEVLA